MTEPSRNQSPVEGPVTDQATTLTLKLEDKEEEVGQISQRERAIIFGIYGDTLSRIGIVLIMGAIFVFLNWKVLHFLRIAFDADVRQMEMKPPVLLAADRLITSNVLMTLIGATVVQVGVSMAAIVSYLFPKANNSE